MELIYAGVGILASIVIGLIGIIYHQMRKDIDEHIAECIKIPKGVIIEKLDSLCEKQDHYYDEQTKFQERVEGAIDTLRTRTHDLANKVQAVSGRVQLLEAKND